MVAPRRNEYVRGERRRQSAWKLRATELPDEAKRDGSWKGIPCSYLLPTEYAAHGLWSPVREMALSFFERHNIKWHDERRKEYGAQNTPGPAPHLLDSQVCAINFWWGLARSPDALTAVIDAVFGDVVEVYAPRDPLVFCVPQWMGLENYLGEKGSRRPGEYATSADFLLTCRTRGGALRGVLLESKYTETYERAQNKRFSPRGTDRAAIYRPTYERPEGPLRHDLGVNLEELLIEPFDQHLRQQLLAAEMQRARELDLDEIVCVHVAPAANRSFHETITEPRLRAMGRTVAEVWSGLLRDRSSYRSDSYERLFAVARALDDPALGGWAEYISDRHGWDIE